MRALGLGSGFFAVGGVLYQRNTPLLVWLALVANGFLWPTLAYLLARRSRNPHRTEKRNLTVDSMLGGIWVAMMHFNALPSALITVMLCADKIAVGGWRFLGRTLGFQIAACAVTWAMLGFPFAPSSSMFDIVACMPFLMSYPLAISTAAYALGRRVVRQNRQLERLSRTDGQTGLANRMHLEEAARIELSRSQRTGRPAALMLLDTDHFKDINDRYGHAIGDTVIRAIASILRSMVREIDTPARYGGDEFAIVLAEAESSDLFEVAERIRARVEATRFNEIPGLACTVSIGVAIADTFVDDFESWMRRADAALYNAKEGGRNRVAAAPPKVNLSV